MAKLAENKFFNLSCVILFLHDNENVGIFQASWYITSRDKTHQGLENMAFIQIIIPWLLSSSQQTKWSSRILTLVY